MSFIVAALWLIGVSCYAILASDIPGIDDAASGPGIVPVADEFIGQGIAGKHNKLPQHWTHQRWGAV